jgi:hypothetical protein
MSFEVFIRRNGKILGTFDRDEFFSARLQGGILDEDEWIEVGGSFWKTVALDAPYKSSNERTRDRIAREHAMIARASNDVYNYRMWAFRILERNDHCLPENIQSLDDEDFGFIEAISIAGFGGFGPERKITFLHNQPDVRMLSGFTNQWIAENGMGKTSLGLALEAVRDTAHDRSLSKSAEMHLHREYPAKIIISLRYRSGLKLATLEVLDSSPNFFGRDEAVSCLKRTVFHPDYSLDLSHEQLREIIEGTDFEYLRMNWLKVDESIPPRHDGFADAKILRHRLSNAPLGVTCTARLLLILREAEMSGQILVLENPTCRLDRVIRQKFERLFVESPRRGTRQIIIMTTS